MEPCDARLSRKVFIELIKEALQEHLQEKESRIREEAVENNVADLPGENEIVENNEEVYYKWVCLLKLFSW